MAIAAKTARYISLDNKGFEIGALEFGELRLACSDVPEELAQEGDLEKITQHLMRLGHETEAAACEAKNAKDFYGLGHDCLWITFARDHLWWTFADPQIIWMMNEFVLTGERVRKSIGGWRNTDINGVPLTLHELNDRIKGLATHGPMDPDSATLCELLQLINDNAAPAMGTERRSSGTGKTSSFQVPSTLFTVGDIIKKPSAAPDEAGIYAWWFDELPNVPLAGALERDGFRLAYVGIASYRAGSRRTLRQRLRNHCNGPIATSTLRRSLAAVLIDQLNLHPRRVPGQKTRLANGEEARLTEWLIVHGRVAWITSATPWLLEDELLLKGPSLALNIRGNAHPFVRELLTLRQKLSDIRDNTP
jgi:GIY-YIG catalytic domain